MKKSKFTETQIVSVLKQVESGLKVDDVCRQFGISPATYYNWKAKYGGMEASELKKMKDMEAELNQLKRFTLTLALRIMPLRSYLKKSFNDS